MTVSVRADAGGSISWRRTPKRGHQKTESNFRMGDKKAQSSTRINVNGDGKSIVEENDQEGDTSNTTKKRVTRSSPFGRKKTWGWYWVGK